MHCVTDYLARAADLEKCAAEAATPAHRDDLLQIACMWRNLALQARTLMATEALLRSPPIDGAGRSTSEPMPAVSQNAAGF
jgi:hypothetical protein